MRATKTEEAGPSLGPVRAVQMTRFGGPEVLEVVDLPDPVPADGQQFYDVSTAGIDYAGTHQIENSYLSAQELPLLPGAEFVGTPVGGGRRWSGCWTAAVRRTGGRAGLPHLAGARRCH